MPANNWLNMDRAIRRVAESAIREALERGAFDNLAGAGKPIPGLDEPFDGDWWVRNWVQRERLKNLREES